MILVNDLSQGLVGGRMSPCRPPAHGESGFARNNEQLYGVDRV